MRGSLRLSAAVLVLLTVGLGAGPAAAQNCPGWSNPLVAFANETMTVGPAPTTLSQSKYATATHVAVAALMTVLTAAINIIDDGSTATNTIGAVVQPNERIWLCGHTIGAASLIRNGGVTATVQVVYYAVP